MFDLQDYMPLCDLIVAPPSVALEEVARRAGAALPARRMTHTAPRLTLPDDLDMPLHVFSLPSRFRRVFVAREFPLLYATPFTASWLARLANHFSEEGAVHVEPPNPKVGRKAGKLDEEYTRNALPGADIAR